MKKTVACLAAVLLIGSAPAFAEDWTGKISDSMCGTKKHSAEHEGKKITDHDCVNMCAAKGKYVFVAGDKMFQIANQDFAGLKVHAGHTDVTVTGDMKGDTVTITKIAMPAAKK